MASWLLTAGFFWTVIDVGGFHGCKLHQTERQIEKEKEIVLSQIWNIRLQLTTSYTHNSFSIDPLMMFAVARQVPKDLVHLQTIISMRPSKHGQYKACIYHLRLHQHFPHSHSPCLVRKIQRFDLAISCNPRKTLTTRHKFNRCKLSYRVLKETNCNSWYLKSSRRLSNKKNVISNWRQTSHSILQEDGWFIAGQKRTRYGVLICKCRRVPTGDGNVAQVDRQRIQSGCHGRATITLFTATKATNDGV